MNNSQTLLRKMQEGCAVLTLFAFLFSSLSAPFLQASLWEERKAFMTRQAQPQQPQTKAEFTQLASIAGLAPIDLSPIRSNLNSGSTIKNTIVRSTHLYPGLPSRLFQKIAPYGDILRFNTASAHHPTPQLLVVHIQDVHGIYGAQQNIAQMIRQLRPELVGLEGWSGPLIALEKWRGYPDKNDLSDAAQFLLKAGFLSGPESAGLSIENSKMVGLENDFEYQDQVKVFQQTLKDPEDSVLWIRQIEKNVQTLKQKYYTPEMAALGQTQEAWKKGQIELGAWLNALTVQVPMQNSGPIRANIQRYLNAYRMEKELNFKNIENEQRKLLKELITKLDPAKLKMLAQKSLDYRLKKIGSGDFYAMLQELCHENKIAFGAGMRSYFEYIAQAENIEKENLFAEIEELEESVWDHLAKTLHAGDKLGHARASYEIDRDFVLMKKALEFVLTPSESERLQRRRLELLRIVERIAAVWVNDPSHRPMLPAIPLTVQKNLESAVRFGELSDQRSKSLTANLLKQLGGQPSGGSNLTPQIAVLVAGGFHSEGIEKELKKAGVSFVTIRPRMSAEEIEKAPHPLEAFKRPPTPLELAFLPEKINLAPRPGLSHPYVVQTLQNILQAAEVLHQGDPAEQENAAKILQGYFFANQEAKRIASKNNHFVVETGNFNLWFLDPSDPAVKTMDPGSPVESLNQLGLLQISPAEWVPPIGTLGQGQNRKILVITAKKKNAFDQWMRRLRGAAKKSAVPASLARQSLPLAPLLQPVVTAFSSSHMPSDRSMLALLVIEGLNAAENILSEDPVHPGHPWYDVIVNLRTEARDQVEAAQEIFNAYSQSLADPGVDFFDLTELQSAFFTLLPGVGPQAEFLRGSIRAFFQKLQKSYGAIQNKIAGILFPPTLLEVDTSDSRLSYKLAPYSDRSDLGDWGRNGVRAFSHMWAQAFQSQKDPVALQNQLQDFFNAGIEEQEEHQKRDRVLRLDSDLVEIRDNAETKSAVAWSMSVLPEGAMKDAWDPEFATAGGEAELHFFLSAGRVPLMERFTHAQMNITYDTPKLVQDKLIVHLFVRPHLLSDPETFKKSLEEALAEISNYTGNFFEAYAKAQNAGKTEERALSLGHQAGQTAAREAHLQYHPEEEPAPRFSAWKAFFLALPILGNWAGMTQRVRSRATASQFAAEQKSVHPVQNLPDGAVESNAAQGIPIAVNATPSFMEKPLSPSRYAEVAVTAANKIDAFISGLFPFLIFPQAFAKPAEGDTPKPPVGAWNNLLSQAISLRNKGQWRQSIALFREYGKKYKSTDAYLQAIVDVALKYGKDTDVLALANEILDLWSDDIYIKLFIKNFKFKQAGKPKPLVENGSSGKKLIHFSRSVDPYQKFALSRNRKIAVAAGSHTDKDVNDIAEVVGPLTPSGMAVLAQEARPVEDNSQLFLDGTEDFRMMTAFDLSRLLNQIKHRAVISSTLEIAATKLQVIALSDQPQQHLSSELLTLKPVWQALQKKKELIKNPLLPYLRSQPRSSNDIRNFIIKNPEAFVQFALEFNKILYQNSRDLDNLTVKSRKLVFNPLDLSSEEAVKIFVEERNRIIAVNFAAKEQAFHELYPDIPYVLVIGSGHFEGILEWLNRLGYTFDNIQDPNQEYTLESGPPLNIAITMVMKKLAEEKFPKTLKKVRTQLKAIEEGKPLDQSQPLKKMEAKPEPARVTLPAHEQKKVLLKEAATDEKREKDELNYFKDLNKDWAKHGPARETRLLSLWSVVFPFLTIVLAPLVLNISGLNGLISYQLTVLFSVALIVISGAAFTLFYIVSGRQLRAMRESLSFSNLAASDFHPQLRSWAARWTAVLALGFFSFALGWGLLVPALSPTLGFDFSTPLAQAAGGTIFAGLSGLLISVLWFGKIHREIGLNPGFGPLKLWSASFVIALALSAPWIVALALTDLRWLVPLLFLGFTFLWDWAHTRLHVWYDQTRKTAELKKLIQEIRAAPYTKDQDDHSEQNKKIHQAYRLLGRTYAQALLYQKTPEERAQGTQEFRQNLERMLQYQYGQKALITQTPLRPDLLSRFNNPSASPSTDQDLISLLNDPFNVQLPDLEENIRSFQQALHEIRFGMAQVLHANPTLWSAPIQTPIDPAQINILDGSSLNHAIRARIQNYLDARQQKILDRKETEEKPEPLILVFKSGEESSIIKHLKQILPERLTQDINQAVAIFIGDQAVEKKMRELELELQKNGRSARFMTDQPGRWSLAFGQWPNINVELILDAMRSVPMKRLQTIMDSLQAIPFIESQA